MPSITDHNLTLNRVNVGTNTDRRVDVTYTAHFSKLERNLAGLGMIFQEEIVLIGVDPPGSTTGSFLQNVTVGGGIIPVTAGNDEQAVRRQHTRIVSRASLNEDPGTITADDDEIRCRIRILAIGLPLASTDTFTVQRTLVDEPADA
jgi:hypothetical protein